MHRLQVLAAFEVLARRNSSAHSRGLRGAKAKQVHERQGPLVAVRSPYLSAIGVLPS
jgi:hypothetical protein